nr:hypothetical protein [Tanacetum cinerariifolium]
NNNGDSSVLLSDLARKVKNIDGRILGRDDKPMKPYRCVKWVDPPSIPVKIEDDTRAGDEWNCVGDASSNGDDGRSTKAGKPVVTNVSPNISQRENEAPLYKLQPAIDEICDKFAFTLYGYFIGSIIALPVVENYVRNTWAKYGIERVTIRNGFFLFKFASYEGMSKVLETGPWLIKSKPIVLSIWSDNTKMEKEAVTKVAVWVNIHNVSVVAFSEIGLSLITLQLGRPLMLDARTSDLCLNPWGRSTYARALVDHTLDTLDVQYEWRPPRCMTCKKFDHETDVCPSRGKKAASTLTLGNGNRKNDGSMRVVQTKPMEGVKQPVKVKQPKALAMVNTNNVGDISNKPPEAPLEEDKVLEAIADSSINGDYGTMKSNEKRVSFTNQSLREDVRSKESGSLWEHFQEVKKGTTSKSQSSNLEDESDEDEVFL